LAGRITAPMETIGDPDLQAYFERSRRATGLNVIPARNSAEESARQPRSRRDRRPGFGSARGRCRHAVELFGAPARLPLGPAALALESGAPAWLVATRRVGRGAYRSRIEEIVMPTDGSRRDRLSGFMANEGACLRARHRRRTEQWWTAFFPIWEDIPA
jgi:lauroyl/myristoyl acyltransferase